MKLYHFPVAPNPSRVVFYLNEKDIPVERVVVNLLEGEQKSDRHLARNPDGVLPVLELDDGSFLTESLPIMEYLEERFPEPCMIGSDALTRARVRSLERWVEMNILIAAGRLVHATASPLGLPPNEGVAQVERHRLRLSLEKLEDRIIGPFVAGDKVTIADCTLLAALNFARFGNVDLDPKLTRINQWFERYALRHL
jgi:glutathione S-transferase